VLYHNKRDGTFEDVTAKSGLKGGRGWGMGVAVADYDNDGFAGADLADQKNRWNLFSQRSARAFRIGSLREGGYR
jgi:FG-GAP-like repeat